MKKTVAILTGLLPFFYAGMIVLLILVNSDDKMLFALMGIYSLMGLLLPLLFNALTTKAARKFLARCNVWFYGGNFAFFLAECIFWLVRLEQNRIAEQNGAIEGGLGLVLLILIYLPHWLSYMFTRIAGAVGCARVLQDKSSPSVRICHILLQMIPITDLISAIWVLHHVKKEEN